MQITTLGTGSSGNCYIITSTNGRQIILDCGLPFNEIVTNKSFKGFDNVDFVFCGHLHKDHHLSYRDFQRSGIKCISWEEPNKSLEVGQYKIKLFNVEHNVPNCGILIKDTIENETLCYATDFSQMPKVEGVDTWLYEINYDNSTVTKLIAKNEISMHLLNAMKNHNSLESAKEYFKNIQYKPKQIVFCHLSKGHCNHKKVLEFGKTICDNVRIAIKGE